MRALVQRVAEAAVRVDGETIGEIGAGLLVLICAMEGDTEEQSAYLTRKTSKMRIFRDEAGKMNRSVLDQGGAVLVVSQFTLAADTRSGNRPGFSTAARPELGKQLYLDFVERLKNDGLKVATGEFGADMKVSLVNDGPVTIWIDTNQT